MSSIKNRNTKPELALRATLWNRGLRYRLKSRLPGKPDIVFPGSRVAVFVDGDFWHGNAWQVRNMPTFETQFERMNNSNFWRAKILTNMARDNEVNQTLAQAGWSVYRVFESRLEKEIELVTHEIEALVRARQKRAATARRRPIGNGESDAEVG
jgi:DNA mismatch endonuclease (patch repair protein)